MSDNTALDESLARIMPRLRDLSMRDGVQSWDANNWRIADILPITREINTLAKVVDEELHVKLPPVEVWGGGQVAQPARFLHEDPFVNLEKIHEAAPDLDLQCLYRGRQCFGFKPVSDKVQKAAIGAAAERGIKVFRIFDMMDDIENVRTGIEALKEYKQTHPDIVIEGAISYISEPAGKRRAWELSEYADYAVQLAKAGCDEICIKNFAGVNGHEMPELIRTIRAKLDEAGMAKIPVNLHIHGPKTETLVEAMQAGAGKVDVAIGDLSGGPSHTNMRDVIMALLKAENKGFTDEEINAHPVMRQLAVIEEAIGQVVHRKGPDGKSFDERRGPLKSLDPQKIEEYRMAGGALSDLWSRISSDSGFAALSRTWVKMGIPKNKRPETPEIYLEQVLRKAAVLWEKIGRFNTVTPGAKILTDQALKLVNKEIEGQPVLLGDYDDTFTNIATGRFGHNQGMEKKIEGVDIQLRDAMLMYHALEVLNASVTTPQDKEKAWSVIVGADFGGPGERLRLTPKGLVNTKDPQLENILRKEGTLERFKNSIERSSLDASLKEKLRYELTPGRSPTPTDGLEAGEAVIKKLGIDIDEMHKSGKPISDAKTAGLLAMLLRDGSDKIFNDLARSISGVPFAASMQDTLAAQTARGTSRA